MIVAYETATGRIVRELPDADAAEREDMNGLAVIEVPDDYDPVLGNYAIVDGVPVDRLAQLTEKKQLEISEAFLAATKLGCDSPLGRVDCDETAGTRIKGLLDLWDALPIPGVERPETILFTMYDRNIKVPHSYEQLRTLAIVVGLAFLGRFSIKQALETQLAAAATAAEISAIDANGAFFA